METYSQTQQQKMRQDIPINQCHDIVYEQDLWAVISQMNSLASELNIALMYILLVTDSLSAYIYIEQYCWSRTHFF